MKKINLFLLVFISLNTFAQSKFPSKKVAEKFLERTLIVELDQDNSTEFNGLLKDVFGEWTLTKVKFMSKSEVDDVVQAKNEEYAILSCGNKVIENFLKFDVFSMAIYLAEEGKKRDKKFLDVRNYDSTIMRGPYVYNVSFVDRPTTKEDVKFALNEMTFNIPLVLDKDKEDILAKDRTSKVKLMKSKTLLIPKESLTISESDVKAAFTHKYEIMYSKEIATFIGDKSKDYTYLKVIFSQNVPGYALGIIDIETGKILDELPLMMTSFASTSLKLKETIGKREIKNLDKLITYKIKKFGK